MNLRKNVTQTQKKTTSLLHFQLIKVFTNSISLISDWLGPSKYKLPFYCFCTLNSIKPKWGKKYTHSHTTAHPHKISGLMKIGKVRYDVCDKFFRVDKCNAWNELSLCCFVAYCFYGLFYEFNAVKLDQCILDILVVLL